MRQDQLDPIIKDIVEKSIRPAITVSITDIQDAVKRRTGYLPSKSVVKYSLNRIGIVTKPKTRRWIRKTSDG